MAQLGWYVHLRKGNYERYGIRTNGGTDNVNRHISRKDSSQLTSEDRSAIRVTELAQIHKELYNMYLDKILQSPEVKSGSKEVERSELENFLNEMWNLNEADEYYQIQQQAIQYGLEELDEKILDTTDFYINKETMNIQSKHTSLHKIEKATFGEIENAVARLTKYKAAFHEQVQNRIKVGEINKTIKEYEKLYQQIEKLSGDLPKKIKGIKRTNSTYRSKLAVLQNKINTLIAQYIGTPVVLLGSKDDKKLKGTWIENYGAQLGLMRDHVANKEANKIIDEMIAKQAIRKNNIGAVTASAELTSPDLPDFFHDEMLTKYQTFKIDTKPNESQNKIDVQVDFFVNDDIGKKMMNLSFKNVKTDVTYLKLTDSSNLLYLLQNGQVGGEQATIYANHFMNLYSRHYTVDGTEQETSNWTALKQKMLIGMKLMMLYKAVSGDTWNKNSAGIVDFLVVANNQIGRGSNQQKWSVFTVGDIIQGAANSLIFGKDTNGNGDSAAVTLTGLKSTTIYDNKMVGETLNQAGAKQRIAYLLAQIARTNITVNIKFDVLRYINNNRGNAEFGARYY